MNGIRCWLLVCICWTCASLHAFAQIPVLFNITPEIFNGRVAVRLECEVTNNATYYVAAKAYNCVLGDPDGNAEPFATDGGYQPGQSRVVDDQYVTIFGTYQGYGQSGIELAPLEETCDEDGCDYYDPFGFSDLEGVPECDASCTIYGSGTEETPYETPALQISNGQGSVYVDVTTQVSPVSTTLEAGDPAPMFTAEVAGVPAGGSTAVTWTISPAGIGSISSCTAGSLSCTYTPPTTISNTNLTLKGCSVAAPTSCDTVSIALLAETISVSTPSPSVLLADGVSNSYLNAYIINGPESASVTWGASLGQAPAPTGAASATYTAPLSSTAFSTPSAGPTTTVALSATITGSNPAIKADPAPGITLVQPVSITGGVPATLAAGSTTTITISGGGFGTSPSVSLSSSWQGVTFTQTSATNNAIVGTLAIPLNTQNVTASQGITFTVSATNAGLTSAATSSAINITFASYTYTLTLTSTSPSLTYGSLSAITPHVACKTSAGAACPGGVPNPQTANFSLIAGSGSLSNTSNAASTNFTASTMIGTPQTATVQACATVATSVCTTVSESLAATTVTLTPGALPGPLAAGKTQGFSATIQNPGIASQLTWTLTPSGAVAGTLASATSAITGSATSGISGSGTSPANTYTAPNPITTPASVTLRVCMSVNALICATPVTIQLPGFSVTVVQIGATTGLSLGHSARYTVTVAALDGFSGSVALSVGGLPAGVTSTLSTQSIATSGTATLTLTSAYASSTHLGSSTVTVSGVSSGYPTPAPAAIALTTRALQYPCVTH